MNKASDIVSYSKFGFFWKKVATFRKNLKIDNFLYVQQKNKIKNPNIVENKYSAPEIISPNCVLAKRLLKPIFLIEVHDDKLQKNASVNFGSKHSWFLEP